MAGDVVKRGNPKILGMDLIAWVEETFSHEQETPGSKGIGKLTKYFSRKFQVKKSCQPCR